MLYRNRAALSWPARMPRKTTYAGNKDVVFLGTMDARGTRCESVVHYVPK